MEPGAGSTPAHDSSEKRILLEPNAVSGIVVQSGSEVLQQAGRSDPLISSEPVRRFLAGSEAAASNFEQGFCRTSARVLLTGEGSGKSLQNRLKVLLVDTPPTSDIMISNIYTTMYQNKEYCQLFSEKG